MTMPFKPAPIPAPIPVNGQAVAHGPPRLVDGAWVYTKDGKPRQPGSMRGLLPEDDSWLEWDEEMLAYFDKLQNEPWDNNPQDVLEFDESQLPKP